jgi:hypothetical protein
MKPKGQTQPHIDFPISMPTITNEAIATQGKTMLAFHPLNINCMVVKASPALGNFCPHVQRTGNKSGSTPRLKIIELKKMNDSNWTTLRGVLYLSSLCLSFCVLKRFAFSCV